jgi:murein DD-endopeptidase MepM/ murein hydrolase activator NlpD
MMNFFVNARTKKILLSVAAFTLAASFFPLQQLSAARNDDDDVDEELVDELEDKIDEQQERINAINREIEEHNKRIQEVQSQKKSLQSEVSALDLSKSKIETSIKKTETSITKSKLTIQKLAEEINIRAQSIDQSTDALEELLRELESSADLSGIELYLSGRDINDTMQRMQTVTDIQTAIEDHITVLEQERGEMIARQQLTEAEVGQLAKLTGDLANERVAVLATKGEKDKLLTATKNQESEYQRILAEKVAERAAFERELQAYESQLAIAIDSNKFPTAGSRVLAWPLDRIVVTQLFGNSEFAAKNPSIYGGRAYHPGTDFGVPTGSSVYATLSGTITHTGNTDAIPGCYSWGKWILLKHDNGLTSLYAHLSSINVSPGDTVKTGEVIGYSGNTGYSTGPHLHYTLYASEGVRVVPFSEVRSTTSCAGAVTPTAAADAYLDPLDYLPQL